MKTPRLNFVLLTLDSFRADAVGGSLTPSLNRFADSAVVFTHAFAQGSYTSMSVPALLTGRYPSRLPVLTMRGMFGVQVEAVPTLAQLLNRLGYHTVGLHSNPFLSRIFGYHRGFDYFYDDLFLSEVRLSRSLRLLLDRIQRIRRLHPYLPAQALNRKVLVALNEAKEPFFLWVHYMDTHGPYQPSRGWAPREKIRAARLWFKATRRPGDLTSSEREELRASYCGRVAYLDKQLGSLFEALRALPSWERTVVIVTADHGDEFGEHGGYTHGHKLYDELIHVPLLVRIPGRPPRIVGKLVELIQIVPTVLELVRTGRGISVTLDGASLAAWLEGTRADDAGVVYSEAEISPHYVGCVRASEWKLICDEKVGAHRLYRLSSDPGEQRDVFDQYADVAQSLTARLNQHRSAETVPEPTESLSREEEMVVEARLRALGYL